MRKEIIVYSLIALVLLVLVFFIRPTGYAVLSTSPSAVRSISVNGNDVLVKLNISSNSSTISTQEVLPKNSKISSYNISEDYGIFEFNPSTNEWIISDEDKTINCELSYTFHSSSSGRLSGKFSYVKAGRIYSSPVKGISSFKII